MILRFTPGSEAEKTVKQLIASRDEEERKAIQIVEDVTGLKPKGFGYRWYFSISYDWSPFNIGFESDSIDSIEIEGLKYMHKTDDISYFECNKRTKKGKEIIKAFKNVSGTDSTPLNEFGIFTEKEMRYTHWQVGEDEISVWIAIPELAFKWLTPHPDVFLETEIQTINTSK